MRGLSRHTRGCAYRSGVTPQSPSVTAPLSGAPELRRSPALPSLKGKVARERRKGFLRIQEGGIRRSGVCPGTRGAAFIAAGLTPQSPSVTAPLSGAPELRRSPALPSLKGKVARERRKGFSEYRRVALGGAGGLSRHTRGCVHRSGVTPQSPSVTAPLSGAPGLRPKLPLVTALH